MTWRLYALILLVIALSNSEVRAQHVRIYATAIGNDSAAAFMGGSSNGSGLYQSDDTGKTWKHLGWNNIKCYSMDEVQSSNGQILYLATGLGVLRSEDFGETWKQLTDWRISEAMDVAVNQKNPNEIYIATAHGPWRSRDGGRSWSGLMNGLSVPYCSRVVIDSALPGHILLAAEVGLFSLVHDSVWKCVSSYKRFRDKKGRERQDTIKPSQVRSILQESAHYWQVGGETNRELLSHDSGKTFFEIEMGPTSLWSVGGTSGKWGARSSGFDYWDVTLLGSAKDLELDISSIDVIESSRTDSLRNVAACLVVPIKDVNYVSIIGTLGNGLYLMNDRDKKRQLFRGTEITQRDLIGDQKLPGRQIWTLKSYMMQK